MIECSTCDGSGTAEEIWFLDFLLSFYDLTFSDVNVLNLCQRACMLWYACQGKAIDVGAVMVPKRHVIRSRYLLC